MSTIIAPAGLVPLNAPIPSPRQFDLLAAATLIDPESPRWLAGAWTGGDPPGPAYTHDPCSAGTNRIKEPAGIIAQQMSGRFTVYLPGFCTAQSIGPNPQFFKDRLELAFKVYERIAVERVMVSGDGHGTLGPYLGDTNMEDISNGAVSSLRGLELLEEAIAEHGSGIIHAAPATATAWASDSLLAAKGGKMYTVANGTPVAVGAGYSGVQPEGESAPAADQQWAFASGPIEIYQGDIFHAADNWAEALDRSNNDAVFIAERPYLINWIARQDTTDDRATQAGVLIDLVP